MGLENLLSKVKRKVSIPGLIVFGALSIGGLASYLSYKKDEVIKSNIQQNSFYVGRDAKAFLENKDLDGDGKYETVIKYVGKDGKYKELPIVRNEKGIPEIVYPKIK